MRHTSKKKNILACELCTQSNKILCLQNLDGHGSVLNAKDCEGRSASGNDICHLPKGLTFISGAPDKGLGPSARLLFLPAVKVHSAQMGHHLNQVVWSVL